MRKKTRAKKWDKAISLRENHLAFYVTMGRIAKPAHDELKLLLDKAYKAKETNNRETMNEIYQELKNWS